MRFGFLLAALIPVLAQAQGPIETRNHRALSLPFLRFDPRGSLLKKGQKSLQIGFSSANELRYDGSVREDAETERLSFRQRWGVGSGEWTLEVPILSRGGGFMDPLIESWHRYILGISNLRSTVPNGQSEIIVPGSDRFGSTGGIGDITGAFSRPINTNLFWSAGIKLPTGNAAKLLGSGAVDAGASLYGHWKLGPAWTTYAQLGGVWQGKPTALRGARNFVDQESAAVEWQPNSRDSWVFQWQGEGAPTETGESKTDGPQRQLSLGYTRLLSEKQSLQLFFSEDGDFLNYRAPQLANIAPDFSIGVRWTIRF